MSKPKHPDDGMYCPLWRRECVKVCHTCEFWRQIRGHHPQSGADMDTWGCAYTLQTYLTIEHTMAQRQTTATIDALRQEVGRGNDQAISGALGILNAQVREAASQLGAPPTKLIGG